MAKGGGTIGKSAMTATYSVEVTGLDRTKREMEALDNEIRALRGGSYSGTTSTTVSASLGTKDLFVNKIVQIEGRVQTGAQKAMIAAMDRGKEFQTFVLARAVTPTGLSGRGRNGGGRNGPGRDDTGALISAVSRGVESFKSAAATLITGYHGWKLEREGYFKYQEKDPRVNSLGQSIIPTREFLKTELMKLKGTIQ